MQSMKPMINRRQALHSLGALGTTALLAGCGCLVRREPKPVCPDSPEISFPSGPLTIDAHCHVFNGTDLQIEQFFSSVTVRQGGALGFGTKILGSVLQQLAWTAAPSGDAELARLRSLSAALRTCTDKEYVARVGALRQSAYSQGREELQAAIVRSDSYRMLREKRDFRVFDQVHQDAETSAKLEALRLIEALPADVEAYRDAKLSGELVPKSLEGKSLQGVIDFVLQNFQYRYVSVHDYLRTYNRPGVRVVDLMLPSMVDYDFWLAKGKPTLTPLSTQVEVMRQIAILTGGRVHALVPFDPLRQVAFALGHAKEDSFTLVTDAIKLHGCVGVKLYPPMGFAALGNDGLTGEDGKPFWQRDWLPAWAARPDLGHHLDTAMREMLGWCERNDVPVMAHTSLSNGVIDKFEELAGSQYWQNALNEFPKLRVSFGHFGDTSPVEDGISRARGFTALMSAIPGKPGSNAFADAGYFVEVLRKQPELLSLLRQLYLDPLPAGRAPLAARLMYGTDWEMTLSEGEIGNYLADFVELFVELEPQQAMREQGVGNLSDRFFGNNAADWVGLHKGEPARHRLESFYQRHGVTAPDWANKLG